MPSMSALFYLPQEKLKKKGVNIMGESDELTKEDLINLGEVDPDAEPTPGEPQPEPGGGEPEPEPEPTPEPEPEPGEPAPEPEPEPDAPVPLERWNKMYGEKKENERKFDLFKRVGAEKYYEVYPDEKPEASAEDFTKPEEKALPSFSVASRMKISGGEYDGMTLAEVHENDPFAAMDMYNEYRDGIRAQNDKAKASETRIQEETDTEHNAFYEARSKELFGKDLKELDEPQQKQIHDLMMKVMDQMEEMGVYKLESAYRLATLDDQIKNAKGQSIKSLIDSARKGKVTHIDSKRTGEDTPSGYEGMESLTEDQLSAHIDSMSDDQAIKFWKDAPASFIAKFKSMADAWI